MSVKKHIAIIEDEAALRDNYASLLRQHGYLVDCYADRPTAEQGLADNMPQLAIIDIGLKDEYEGGFALCQWLRSRSQQVAIMFLTARDSDIDTITGLRIGADDYLNKNISLVHLTARINALFRRMQALNQSLAQQQTKGIELGALRVDLDKMQVSWQDNMLDLTVTEFWMLHSLVKHPGHVRNRSQLMQDAHMVVDDTTITSHIKRIRRKFEQLDSQFQQIETVYGMGYRWKV
ncbi:two component transcriptional regulator, winged helix family protein [Catenovulum agarivorans DS-2]|uniref:Two component transcriptional regulator, winged helix family protein n=1 Tax=Catenovulum agarivorans DS-2 TaxID=1328313 RepID=W7QQH4_9ALTE|nr:proteobacterial dedicated sortase system response regulator [Catenovulum agarivorans]EWH10133.1 two component transcriptional regulator, winged helix family protein [Catenovulum agarivorans DS-2]